MLLALSLAVTGWGLTTAIYLERAPLAAAQKSSPESPAAVATLRPTPVPAPTSAPAQAPVPASAPTSAEAAPAAGPALAAIEPAAGPSVPPAAAPQPAESVTSSPPAAREAPVAPLALATPPAIPVPASDASARDISSASDTYWVEYGVFTTAGPAERLQQALEERGMAAHLVRTHTPRGRALLRVRSGLLAEAAARQASQQAELAFGIMPLLHRGSPAVAASHYWVQFGAFHHRAWAQRLKSHLDQSGVAVTITKIRGSSGKPLYLVRSRQLSDHADAEALGRRGASITQADYLVGMARGKTPAPSDSHAHAHTAHRGGLGQRA